MLSKEARELVDFYMSPAPPTDEDLRRIRDIMGMPTIDTIKEQCSNHLESIWRQQMGFPNWLQKHMLQK